MGLTDVYIDSVHGTPMYRQAGARGYYRTSTPSASSGDASTKDYMPDILRQKLTKALLSSSNSRFAAHFKKIGDLSTDRHLLPEGAEAPTAAALASARQLLQQFETENLEPTRVVASVEGGVALCFVAPNKYADIECLNSGEILGVISNRRDRPSVWPVDANAAGFARAVAQIREFCNRAAVSHDAQRETR